VRDHRDRREADDPPQRLGVLGLRDCAADDLAACRRELRDLSDRRLDVVRLRQRHRLHDDGCAAADRDAADPDLPLAGHRSRLTARRGRSCGSRETTQSSVAGVVGRVPKGGPGRPWPRDLYTITSVAFLLALALFIVIAYRLY